jgi:hypothetical protein
VDFQLSLESEGVASAYPDQPLATTVDATVGQALQLLRAQRNGAIMICEGIKLVGILTERDALRLMAEGADFSQSVRNFMSSPPATIPASATVAEAIRTMSEGGYPAFAHDRRRRPADRRRRRPWNCPLSGRPFSGDHLQPAAQPKCQHERTRGSVTIRDCRPFEAGGRQIHESVWLENLTYFHPERFVRRGIIINNI